MLKNVVVVCDYAYIEGGAAKVAIETAIALSRKTNLNIYYIAGCGEICDELKKSRVISKSLGMYDLLGNPSRIKAFIKGIYNKQAGDELKKYLLQLNLDETVVHIHTWTKVLSSAIFKVCDELGVRTFLTIHDYFLICPNGACYNYVKKDICDIKPLSLRCLLCNCDSRSYIQKLWRCLRQHKQNKVINNFVNLNYITISEFQKKQLEKRWDGVKKSSFLMNIIDKGEDFQVQSWKNNCYVFIGRVTHEKGTDIFCKAVADSGVEGIVVGDGPIRKKMETKYPNIKFVGWKEKKEIQKILKQARALIFPSVWYEGAPLTIPEVQVHGIPCIVTDCNAAVDEIIQGENGEVVKPSVESVVSAINKFKDDKYVKKLSMNTYFTFNQKRCSEGWYVDNLVKIYGE